MKYNAQPGVQIIKSMTSRCCKSIFETPRSKTRAEQRELHQIPHHNEESTTIINHST